MKLSNEQIKAEASSHNYTAYTIQLYDDHGQLLCEYVVNWSNESKLADIADEAELLCGRSHSAVRCVIDIALPMKE